MKRVIALIAIILFFSISSFGHAYTSPGKATGYVNDFAKILSAETKNSLETELSTLDATSTIQIAVVTIPDLGNETIEIYAVKLFEEWGIGEKGKDNGVLFLIAPNEKKVRIEVGYGLEGTLTDIQSNAIIQKIVLPEFKNNNYDSGIEKGTYAIISVVKSEGDYSSLQTSSKDWSGFGQFFLFAFFILISILSATKSWWLGGVIGGIVGIVIGIYFGVITGVFATVALIILGLIIDYILSKYNGRGRGGSWIGGFGGRSGGGGFGGFGGGGSGGGGSSGSW